MRYHLYKVLSFIAALAVLSATYFMLRSLAVTGPAAMLEHRAAFFSFIISVLCIETRVRMGYRLPRGPLFWTHLCVAIPFCILLSSISFVMLPAWLGYLCFVLFCVTLGTGVVLFGRGFVRK